MARTAIIYVNQPRLERTLAVPDGQLVRVLAAFASPVSTYSAGPDEHISEVRVCGPFLEAFVACASRRRVLLQVMLTNNQAQELALDLIPEALNV